MGRYQSGQLGRTVTPLAFAFVGSNPALPTFYFNMLKHKYQIVKIKIDYLCHSFAERFCRRKLTGKDRTMATKLDRGSSSVDRASAFQAEGRGFEPRLPLKVWLSHCGISRTFLADVAQG